MIPHMYGSTQSLISGAQPKPYFRLDLARVVFILAGLMLCFLVLEAPLRYGLALVHLDAFIYLPKILLLLAVIFLPLVLPRAAPEALMLTGLVGIYLIWGLVNLNDPMQALFGLWVIVPLLFGLWVGPTANITKWRRLFVMLFIVTATGIFLNPLLQYPWGGQSLTLMGKDIEVSRQWTTLGFERYAGFARASFNAASQLLLFGVMLLVLLKHRGVKLLIWIAAGVGIVLTTSKGPLGAWLLLSMYFVGGGLLRWPCSWIRLWLVVISVILIVMIFLPLSTIWVHYDSSLSGPAAKFLFASFGERMDWMWPDSLNLLTLDGAWHWWVGRGLGGIGVSQQYFEPNHYLPADNLFIYMAVNFGIPVTLILFVGLLLKTVVFCLRRGADTWFLPVVLALMAYGIVVNVIESSLLAFFLGLALAAPVKVPAWPKGSGVVMRKAGFI